VLVAGGYTTTYLAVVESWNGSAWTEVNDLNTGGSSMSGGGTTTSAIAGARQLSPGTTAIAESWDGSSWSEVSDINTARRLLGGDGSSNTNAIIFAGEDATSSFANSDKTEIWDGSSWTEVADLATARGNGVGGAAASSAAALCFGGHAPGGRTASTEEFTVNLANKTITSS
jgi:hypothetical protein